MTWERMALKELCLKVAKSDPVATGRERVRYIDISGVDGTFHRLKEIPEIYSAEAPSRCRQIVSSGDTVFSTVRPYLKKIAYIDDAFDGEFASTGFSVLRPGPRLEPKFLHYFTISPIMFDQILPYQKGVSYPAVLDREVRSVSMPVPPLEEQRRIVAILEDHLSHLDAADASAHKAIDQSQALVISSLRSAIRAGSSEAPTETLGEHAVLVEYGTSAKCHEDASHGDVPVLRMGNIQDGHVDWSRLKYLPEGHKDLERLMLCRGDLVFNRTNSAELVGKTAVFEEDRPASFASYLIRVRMRSTVDPAWASMTINSPQGRAYVTSCVTQQVGQANVNGTKLKAFPLSVPPITRQRTLVSQHRDIAEFATRLRQTATDTLARSAALRRSLLTAAFSGRLTGSVSEVSEVRERIGA